MVFWHTDALMDKQKKLRKYIVLALVIALVLGVSYWLVKQISKPLPGRAVADLGRKHVELGTKVNYNSNPPTSGPHYEEWEKSGIYDQPLQDEKLVHSLEHGYVVISYHCDPPATSKQSRGFILDAFAHQDPNETTPSGDKKKEATVSANLSRWKQDVSCQELVSKLEELAKEMRIWKLIVVPRVNINDRIALTAWTRIDTLADFDARYIKTFINAFRNKGPEQTME